MSDIKIQPSATGNAVVTITPGVSNSARTLTLPDASGTVATTADITSTTTTANAALPKAGGTMSGALTITAGTAKFKLEEIGGSYGELEAGGAGLHINAKTGGYITLRPNGNTEAVRIASNGSVGIGTSSPAFENGSGLEIRYAGGNGAHLKLTDNASGTGATQGLDLYMFNTQAYIENYENAPTIFRNNGAESVRILANGKVGIGDSAPQDWLEVRSSGAIGGITISNSAHNQAALSFARSSTATARIFTSEPAATNTSAMHFQTSNASGGPNLITAMTIDQSQNVGIGVTPDSEWHTGRTSLQIGTAGLTQHDSYPHGLDLIANGILKTSGEKQLNTSYPSNKLQLWNGTFLFKTEAAGNAAISWANPVTIDADGLKFNGDTSGDNALNDYEEGTWTPTMTCSSSGSYTLDTGANAAAYTKIGRVVHVQGGIGVASQNSPSGTVRMSLPFTSFTGSKDTDYSMGSCTLDGAGGNIDNGIHIFVFGASYAQFALVSDSGGFSYLTNGHVDSAWYLKFSFSYIAV